MLKTKQSNIPESYPFNSHKLTEKFRKIKTKKEQGLVWKFIKKNKLQKEV